jgi:hypothetical protein
LVRLKADGAIDPSFGHRGSLPQTIAKRLGILHDLAVQGDGRIVIVGQGPETRKGFNVFLSALRLLPDGTVDRSFGQDGIAELKRGGQAAAMAALTQRNGRVVAGGAFELQDGKKAATELLMTRYLSGSGR